MVAGSKGGLQEGSYTAACDLSHRQGLHNPLSCAAYTVALLARPTAPTTGDTTMQDAAQTFNPFAPGFDFLQKLAAGSTSKPVAAFAQWQEWVAPTMSVPDLEKRIQELKTVLFWLEQNQRALEATIQAMEVQKMTLSALQTMNVPVENWASTMVQSWQQFAQNAAAQAQDAAETAAPQAAAKPPAAPSPAPAAASTPPPAASAASPAPEAATEPPEQAGQAKASPVTDPMQWWGALTQQFQHIAQQAVQDVTEQAMAHAASTQQAAASAAEAVRSTAEGMAEAGKTAAQAAMGRQTAAKRSAASAGDANAAKPSARQPESSPRSAQNNTGKQPMARKAASTKGAGAGAGNRGSRPAASGQAGPRQAAPRQAGSRKPSAPGQR
ncbi:hypothetical protein GCM10027195_12400 [Comamonas sediminis]